LLPCPCTVVPAVCSPRREVLLTAAVGGVVVLFCVTFLLIDRGYFWTDDYQTSNLPAFAEVARAWQQGELPLLSRSSWRGGALAGEYPYGALSPFLTLCVVPLFGLDLPLPLIAAALSITHLAVLAAGAFRLARLRGLSPEAAALVALVASLNGWIFFWGARIWSPCLVSFAWLPWFWWVLERGRMGASGPARFALPGLFLWLIITAGWPFTVLMAAVVSLWLGLRTWTEQRRLRPLWPTGAAWAMGLGLSAPAWMMLLEYTRCTLRGQASQLWLSQCWMVSLDSLPSLVLPQFNAESLVFEHPKSHMAVELTGGLVPLVVLAALVLSRGAATLKALRWEWGLCGLALLLAVSPSVGSFQYSFRWLPFFFLVLGLLAGHGLDLLRRSPAETAKPGRSPNLGRLALYLMLVVWARALFLGLDPTRTTMMVGVGLLIVCAFWGEVEVRYTPAALLRAWMPCAVVLLSCWLTYATAEPFSEVPTWKFADGIRRPAPLDPSVRYLSVYTREDVFDADFSRGTEPVRGTGTELYPGNSAMYAGLDFVNGYSPMMPAGLERAFDFRSHGEFTDEGAERILRAETGPQGLLELAGVDGLVLSDRFAQYRPTLEENDWHEVARVEGGTVFQRGSLRSPRARAVTHAERLPELAAADEIRGRNKVAPLPVLLLASPGVAEREATDFAPAQVSAVRETRNAAEVDVTRQAPDGDVLVVFARAWFPGYRATCDGRPVPVEVTDLIFPAVRLPAGVQGHVVLEYRPRSLVVGGWTAALTGGVVLVVLLAAGLRRRRNAAEERAPAERALSAVGVADSVGVLNEVSR
jgi:hypothetical protein